MYRSAPARSAILVFVAGIFAAGSSQPLRAQEAVVVAAGSQDSVRASDSWFTRRDAIAAAAFAVGTAAMFPFDTRIAKQLQAPHLQSNRALGRTVEGFELTASPGSYWIGGMLFAVGKMTKQPRIADLGLHGTEAVLLATVGHNLIKGLAGRSRPYMSKDTNSTDFDFFRGFGEGGDYRSFPSGHASTAFAAASAVTAEASRAWPKSTPYVGTLMYGGATMVALSRMYSDQHWASDVILGAALGTFSGWKVVQFHHDRNKGRINRALASTTVAPDGQGGFAIGWSLPTP